MPEILASSPASSAASSPRHVLRLDSPGGGDTKNSDKNSQRLLEKKSIGNKESNNDPLSPDEVDRLKAVAEWPELAEEVRRLDALPRPTVTTRSTAKEQMSAEDVNIAKERLMDPRRKLGAVAEVPMERSKCKDRPVLPPEIQAMHDREREAAMLRSEEMCRAESG